MTHLSCSPQMSETSSQFDLPQFGSGRHSVPVADDMSQPQIDLPFSALRNVFEPSTPGYSKRIPNCQKCGQHGRKNRLKGHKRVCPFRNCECEKCSVVTERQKLMADQIKIRRKQRKNTMMNMTRDHITSTINAAAAMSGQMQFPFGNLNALLFNQLKNTPSSLLTSPASSEGSSYSPSSTMNLFAPSPELSGHLTLPPSPPSPQIVAPVPINPAQTPVFPFQQLLNNEALLQSLLANYKLLEQSFEQPIELNNTIIDVCSI